MIQDLHTGPVQRDPASRPVRRVLFVSSGNLRPSVDVLIQSQADSLAALGFEVEHFLVVGRGPRGYLRAIGQLRRRLKSESYDLIHAHYGYCGIVADLARNREALVVSFMGTDLLGPMNRDGSYRRIGRLVTLFNRAVLSRRAECCIAKSENLRRVLSRRSQTEVIPNGINFESFFPVARDQARAALGLTLDRKYVLYIGDPSRPEKCHDLAVTSVARLDDPTVELLTVHGIPRSDVNLYYSAADVLILTSYYEGSPNAVKEAMACNCPVVSVDVGDVRVTIGSARGCHLVTREPAEVAAALRQVLDRGQRTDGRQCVLSLRDDLVSQRIAAVYDRAWTLRHGRPEPRLVPASHT